jgi:hypothetical protein
MYLFGYIVFRDRLKLRRWQPLPVWEYVCAFSVSMLYLCVGKVNVCFVILASLS